MKPHFYLDKDGKWKWRLIPSTTPFSYFEPQTWWRKAFEFCRRMNERRL
jgi:hypothetical protein